jgi:hypothetical protein
VPEGFHPSLDIDVGHRHALSRVCSTHAPNRVNVRIEQRF